jgi:ferredoxin
MGCGVVALSATAYGCAPGVPMPYKQAAFYYWTGTGNSYRAGCWMAGVLERSGAQARVVQLGEAWPGREVGEGCDCLLCMAFPTHGFTAPWSVIVGAVRLPRRRGTHAVVVATRAGIRIGSLCLPGLEGTAAYLIACILLLKGYRVRGVMGLDMPSNWLALHWGLHPGHVVVISRRAQRKAERFIARVLGGEVVLWGLVPLLLGLGLSPISLLYLLLGRLLVPKVFFAGPRCTGCGLCARMCPARAIVMLGAPPRPFWTGRCQSCQRCMAYCPERAVEASHSWALALYFITTIPVGAAAIGWFRGHYPDIAESLDLLVPGVLSMYAELIQWLYLLTAVYALYLPFWLLSRTRWGGRLLAHTTLTTVYRRYHEPETALDQIMPKRRRAEESPGQGDAS